MIEPLVSCARRMCKVASILPESALVSYVCLKVGVSSPVAGIVLFAGIAKAGVVLCTSDDEAGTSPSTDRG